MQSNEYLTRFKATIQKMLEITTAKNHDYGGGKSAFNNFTMVEKLGIADPATGILVRMTDKIARITTLLHSDAKVKDEKIEDTLLDLANYAIIMKLYLEWKKETAQEGARIVFDKGSVTSTTEIVKPFPMAF